MFCRSLAVLPMAAGIALRKRQPLTTFALHVTPQERSPLRIDRKCHSPRPISSLGKKEKAWASD